MRGQTVFLGVCLLLGAVSAAEAKHAPVAQPSETAAPAPLAPPIEVTADQTLEW